MTTTRNDPPTSQRVGRVGTAPASRDRAGRLSLLWLFVLLNYLYCDVLGLYDAQTLKDLINGTGPIPMTAGALFGFAVLMEIPIAMVLLSVVLPHRASRWASVGAAAVMTAVQVSSLFVGEVMAFYAFYSAIEIATTTFIAWFAWTWRESR